MKLFKNLAVTLSIIAVATSVEANDEKSYPNISGDVLFEYRVDSIMDNKDKLEGDETVDSFAEIEPIFHLNFNENWKVTNKWELRPVGEREGVEVSGSERFIDEEGRIPREFHFDDYGLILEELYLQFFNGDLRVVAGKYNPTFAVGWQKDRYHGVYGEETPENYELKEKWGGSISAVLDKLEIRLNTFFNDTTELSDSAFNSRGRDKSRGGAANTEDFSSFTLTATGENLFTIEGLSYNFGYKHLGTDLSEEKDEKGYTFALEYLIEGSDKFKFIPFFEYVVSDDADGVAEDKDTYATISLPFIYGNWSFIASDTHAFKKRIATKNYTDYDYQLSVGYKFENGLMIDVAKRWQKEEGYKADYIGGLVSYLLTF